MPGSESAMRRCTSPATTAYVSSARRSSPICISPHDYGVRTDGAEQVGDIGFEGSVAAFMLAGHGSIHPNCGVIIHGAEMHQQPAAIRKIGRFKRAPIPAGPVKSGIADAA